MYAVIKTGGKQYRVEPGTVVEVELLEGEVGANVELAEVLLVANAGDVQVGRPTVQGAKVTAKILAHKQDKKKFIFKKIRRHGKQLRKGHRQQLTRLQVNEITF